MVNNEIIGNAKIFVTIDYGSFRNDIELNTGEDPTQYFLENGMNYVLRLIDVVQVGQSFQIILQFNLLLYQFGHFSRRYITHIMMKKFLVIVLGVIQLSCYTSPQSNIVNSRYSISNVSKVIVGSGTIKYPLPPIYPTPRSGYQHAPIDVEIYDIEIIFCKNDPIGNIDSILTLVSYFPDGSVRLTPIKSEDIKHTTANRYLYKFPFDFGVTGEVGFCIATQFELSQFSNPSYDEYLSDKQKIYLTH